MSTEGYASNPGNEPYMSMGTGEFCAIDPDAADPDTWQNYLRMKVRIIRDRRESDPARQYFDGIQGAFEQSFAEITPEVLANPNKLNLIRCVDKYSERQLDALNFPPEEQQSLPGGLGWFELTGTTSSWIVARIFSERLAAGIHTNCGGFAITGALTAERQASAIDRAMANTQRAAGAIAAVARHEFLRRKGSRVDPDAKAAVATFTGPELILPIGNRGTAQDFITPRGSYVRRIDEQFTPAELERGFDRWVEGHLAVGQEVVLPPDIR